MFTEVVEDAIEYQVQRGDTLLAIAGRFGANWQVVASANSLRNPDRLYPGQRVTVVIRRITPSLLQDGIVINIPEAVLYYFRNGHVVFSAGVGLGQPGRWRTPTGRFKIISKKRHPIWEVPISIQREMEAEGRVVLTRMPPGPDNPLGEFWLGLSIPGYGIHGTIAPSSIGQYQSHGCIRMHPEDMSRLFSLVEVGTPGFLAYDPVKIAIAGKRLYLETHPDVYGIQRPCLREIEASLRALGISVDWVRVTHLLRAPTRIAEVISAAG